MKRYIIRAMAILPLLLAVLAVVSCTEDPEPSFKETEARSLEAWIKKYRPELLENKQEDGGYYVEVLSAGTPDSLSNTIKSVLDSDDDEIDGCWVSFNMTGRDLQGQVCLTRDGWTARMEGTFTKFTHYVPYLRFVGKNNVSLLEGTYLAMKNTLTLGSQYASDNGLPTELSMCHGTKLRLYLPSSIVGGANGFSGDGGYEGQFSLDGNRPMIMEIEITDRINNPVAYEACVVDGFGIANGGVSPIKEVSDNDEEGDDDSSEEEDDDEEEDDGLAWRHSCDTIPGLLVTKRYTPATKLNYSFDFTVDADEDEDTGTTSGGKSMANTVYRDTDPASVYANFDLLEEQINAALIERFGEGSFDGEKIGEEGKAKVWYITRFLDGFILDSNIAEVRKIVYGADEATDNEITYCPKDDQNDYIAAWYYAMQELRYGQWATLITTSTFAYGSVGRSGSTSTTTSGSSYSYMPYYNYYNYYNSYYGSSYYDMYYYNYYNNYLYNSYYSSSDTTTTTTSTSTEVQSYTPLIFQIFIEPEED